MRASVEHYFDAIASEDIEQFCASIVPALGSFENEDDCILVSRQAVESLGRLTPRYQDGPVLDQVRATVLAVRDIEVTKNEASAAVSLWWSGKGPEVEHDLGSTHLRVLLARDAHTWRIAGFEPWPGYACPERPDREERDVARAAVAYLEAIRLRGPAHAEAVCAVTAVRASRLTRDDCPARVGYPLDSRLAPDDHVVSSVLVRVGRVEMRGVLAGVELEVHVLDNGVMGHPQRGWRLFAFEDGRWGHVWGEVHPDWDWEDVGGP